eukprot:364087_1
MQTFECALSVETLPSSDVNYSIAARIKHPYDLSYYIGDDESGERINKSLFLPTRHKPYAGRIGICSVKSINEVRQNNKDGSTLHIEFDLTFNSNYNAHNPIIAYRTADNMGFIARNSYKQVDKLCKRLKLNKKDMIRIEPTDEDATANYTFPQMVSIENIFLWFLDVNGAPSKKILRTFAEQFTEDVSEAESLLKLCEDVQANVASKHWTLLDVLNAYPSIEIDIASLIELLKPLQPRLYTIASSSVIDVNKVAICIKLEKEEHKEEERTFTGVQSNYFVEASVGSTFQFYIEESKFKLPAHSIPVIMIAVGAGLAPFAAFIDEGDTTIKSQNTIGKADYAEWWLFFGCRYSNGDYIYKEKLEKSYEDKDGVLDGLKCAFSRDQKKKIYVQHLIEENQEKLWKLIHEKQAKIYVCGGVAMGRAAGKRLLKYLNSMTNQKTDTNILTACLKMIFMCKSCG